jgi:MFS family permease
MRVAPAMYGVVVGSWSVGLLLGPALLWTRSAAAGRRRLMPLSAVVMGAGIAMPALVVDQWSTVAAFALGGAANGLFDFGITAAVLQGVDQGEQGRVWSAFGILASACALLGYLAGAATGAQHARATLLASGILPAAVGLVALAAADPDISVPGSGRQAEGAADAEHQLAEGGMG